MTRALVIGLGNPFRGDDGAGIEAARAIRRSLPAGVEIVEHDGEPAALIDLWDGRETVYVIDAVRSEDESGTIHRLEIDAEGSVLVPASPRRDSSHALGLGDAVDLARVLGRLPERLVLIGISGHRFELGTDPSPDVRDAVAGVAGTVARELAALR